MGQRAGAPVGTIRAGACKTYKLIGLNRKSKTGIYATVQYNGEDWFHADFDPEVFPIDRQYALFDMFKNTEENLWSGKTHTVTVQADKHFENRSPVNPIIKVLYLDI
jgi:hypothetical protein